MTLIQPPRPHVRLLLGAAFAPAKTVRGIVRPKELDDFPAFLKYVWIKGPGGLGHKGAIRYELWPELEQLARDLQSGDSLAILKARQVGGSWTVAAYVEWLAINSPGSVILLLSKGMLSAHELMGKVRFIHEHLPSWLKPRMRTSRTSMGKMEFKNGSVVHSLPASADAGRGFTGDLVVVDEAAFHPFAESAFDAWYGSMADSGQAVVISTANGPRGFFADLWHGAEYKDPDTGLTRPGGNGFKARFLSWRARQGRTDAWLEQVRKAFRGVSSQFKQEYPSTAEDAFVGLTGLVYPMFSEQRHCRVYDPTGWAQCLYRYAAYDLGGGDPTAAAVMGVYRDLNGVLKLHVYDALYDTDGRIGAQEIAIFLLSWQSKAGFLHVEADPAPGGAIVMNTIQAMGVKGLRRGNPTRQEGLSTVAFMLENDLLTFGRACAPVVHEFGSYRWKTAVDQNSKERYATSTPAEHHGDFLDTLRLMVLAAYRDVWNEPTAGTQRQAYAAVRY